MPVTEILLPRMGESVIEATIIKWLKNVGDVVESDEALVEIATDKVDSEVPSTVDGTIKEIKVQEGDVVQVGQVLCLIDTVENLVSATPDSAAKRETIVEKTVSKSEEPATTLSSQTTEISISSPVPARNGDGRFYSPLVRNIAKTEGIPFEKLQHIPGSGKDGRLTKKDILAYIKSGKQESVSPEPTETNQVSVNPRASQAEIQGDVEIIEMDRMRKLIAEHMVLSKQVSPHVCSFVEADVSGLVRWRNNTKDEFRKRTGEKLTYTPAFIWCVIQAIKAFPMINVSVDNDRIIRKKNINIGMATALPGGNLIVPVIKNADRLSLSGLVENVNDLAGRAREHALHPDEIQDGTYTITNVGSFGNVMGTPIINQPQVAILATGVIRKKPAVIETKTGDAIAIRHMMYLSHSYDHRVVDGALGGLFARKVADLLEDWDENMAI